MSNQDYGKHIEIKVGLFVSVAIAIFIISLFSLREGSFLFSTRYTLQVKMDSIEGLGPGSLVQLLGVSIGNVGTVNPLPSENKVLIRLGIDNRYQDLIKEGSTVETKTQGVLGDRFVSINPQDGDGKILRDGDFLIHKSQVDMFSVIASEGDKIENLFVVLQELATLIKSLNANNKAIEIMHNLNESSKGLTELIGSLNILAKTVQEQKKLERSLHHLNSVLRKIDRGQGTLGALINDSTLYDRIDQLLSGSERQTYVKELVRRAIKTGKD